MNALFTLPVSAAASRCDYGHYTDRWGSRLKGYFE